MSDGAKAKVGWGFETVAAGQKATTFYGLRFASLMFKPDPTFERTRNTQGRGQLLKGRILKIALPWSIDFDPSVDDIARLRAHHQGFTAAPALVATGVYDWAIRDLLSTDVLSSDISSLSIDADKDDGYSTLLLGAAIRDMDLKVEANKIVGCKVSGVACNFTHMKNPTFSTNTGTTYTGTLHVRNNRQDADAEDIVNHLKAKCTTSGALDGTAQVKFTKGATAYGAVAYPVVAGAWMDVILADGTHASGNPLNPVQVMFSIGGTLTANDEFTIEAKRPALALTYPSRQPLTAVGLRVTIGGVVYIVDNFDLKFTRPRKEKRGCGSLYPTSLLPDGDRSVTISIKRDYVDRALYLKMLSSSDVAFDATINGDFIATVAGVSYYEKWQMTSANAQILKAGADPTAPKQEEESVDIVPYFDGTNVDMAETIRCTLATLT